MPPTTQGMGSCLGAEAMEIERPLRWFMPKQCEMSALCGGPMPPIASCSHSPHGPALLVKASHVDAANPDQQNRERRASPPQDGDPGAQGGVEGMLAQRHGGGVQVPKPVGEKGGDDDDRCHGELAVQIRAPRYAPAAAREGDGKGEGKGRGEVGMGGLEMQLCRRRDQRHTRDTARAGEGERRRREGKKKGEKEKGKRKRKRERGRREGKKKEKRGT